MHIPISKELASKLFPQIEPNTPGAENPIGEGILIDPQVSIAISLKRIADLLENVIGHNPDRPSIKVTKE